MTVSNVNKLMILFISVTESGESKVDMATSNSCIEGCTIVKVWSNNMNVSLGCMFCLRSLTDESQCNYHTELVFFF